MQVARVTAEAPLSALRLKPIGLAWMLAIGVDLFFNAGVFTRLFDQAREPGLLADEVLFRRIPVAYLALAGGVAALAWLIERRLLTHGSHSGAVLGGLVGFMFALMGVVNLWTAIELTGWFVAGAALVQIAQFAVAGWFLTTYRISDDRGLTWKAIAVAALLALAGVVAQNLLST